MKSVDLLAGCWLVFSWLQCAAGQAQWCGKNYMKGQPSLDPGGHFPIPSKSSQPLLNFRCAPRTQPFIQGESTGSFIVDAGLVNRAIPGAQTAPFTGAADGTLNVVIKSGDTTLASGKVGVNSTGTELSFDPSKLPVDMKATNVSCTATLARSTFTTSAPVFNLPTPANGGSVTKQDFKTGALLVRPPGSAANAAFEPIIPFGLYTSFSDYLAVNLSVVDFAKQTGRNLVHPIPTFDNMTAFNEVLDRMKEQGMWLMFDMRDTFMNLSIVQQQVEMIRDYPNLLLYYTGDEPDGWSYPLNSTLLAGNLISSLDPYHPTSLVLNCYDYFFEEYTQGATIIMQDTYPIGINATFSTQWGTPCNATLGDCGCDLCSGSFTDIPTRVDELTEKLQLGGRSRGWTVWSVSQAFGNETYWPRYPTGTEYTLELVISLNHGSTGLVAWDEDQNMPADLLQSTAILGGALPTITRFFFAEDVKFSSIRDGMIDVGMWESEKEGGTLVLAANMADATKVVNVGKGGGAKTILTTAGSKVSGGRVTLGSLGSLGFVVSS